MGYPSLRQIAGAAVIRCPSLDGGFKFNRDTHQGSGSSGCWASSPAPLLQFGFYRFRFHRRALP